MIGVLGGTFDPVHFGHLRTGLEVTEALGLEQLRLIPSNRPPHRGVPGASAERRLEMLLAAARSEPRFVVDDCELRRAGPSYSVDTLGSLRLQFPAGPICFLVGMDAFLEVNSWHRWQELFGLCHFVVMHRPGVAGDYNDRFRALAAERLVHHPRELGAQIAGKVLAWPVTQLEISATQIRNMVRAGRSTRFLLPDAVLDLIGRWRLYA